MSDNENQVVVKKEALVLQAIEEKLGLQIHLTSFDNLLHNSESNVFTLNDDGYTMGLSLMTYKNSHNPLGSITDEICSLTCLEYLFLAYQEIATIPTNIELLTNLKELKLFNNQIPDISHEIAKLTALEDFSIPTSEQSFGLKNVLPILKSLKFKGTLAPGQLQLAIQKNQDKKEKEYNKLSTKFEKFYNKHGRDFNKVKIKYPSNHEELAKNGKLDYLILTILKDNKFVAWSHFSKIISQSALSSYIKDLIEKDFIYRIAKGQYVISKSGKKNYKKLN